MYDKITFWEPSNTYFHSSADDEHIMNSSANSSIMPSHVLGLVLTIVLPWLLATRTERYVSPVVIDDYRWPALSLVK